jgi:hypothetical protein
MISNDGRQYLEVNLQGLHAVTAIKSQGRYGNGSGKEFVEEIMIDYWRPGSNKWTRWRGRDGKQASASIAVLRTLIEILLLLLLYISAEITTDTTYKSFIM